MAILLFLILLLPLPFFFFLLLKHGNHGGKLPPSPPALPLIGHLHMQLFDNSPPHVFLWKLSQKYGPLVYLRFGYKPTLVVSSAKMAKEVLKTHDLDFCSRPDRRALRRLSYNALDLAFTPYDCYWREVRKLCVVHLFNRVQQYRPIREEEVARLMEKICRLFGNSNPVNLSEAMLCLSSTIICRVGFGKRYAEEGAERSRFHRLFHESEALLSSFSFSDCFPFMGWVDRLTGFHNRLDKIFEELDIFHQELIDEHLDPNRLKPTQEDIIDVLLQIWKDGDFPFDLTIDHIKAILMNVFLAGTDTTAATVIWVMSFLMKNPNCLKRTQMEVRNLIGKKEFLNEDDVQSLPYLQAVIKETFRLQPTAPLLLPRETLRKCSIDGYEVPAKSLVFVNAWAIGKDPETWENPEEFCPERFIGSSIDYKGQDFELIPFGAGRRICPGMRLGVATVELALANLLHKFDWEMPAGKNVEDDLDFDVLPGITTHKKNDLILVARKIDD
ncbi:RED ELONGATED 1, SUPERROOT 2, ALTERED TRYPTOPHAN REGULATION 4, RUNT 1, cytochrome P450, family 83 [Hibiscus trionum]|uniref:RED ELONGATED 1, SUPERROOT 2, ALTERED TRYPTOPHAN REGULATION 4, RUNT 1, cytochrome P450, family 83 n=1 Tax=Hibiscus trionum TaxID=183268 RepID=A0A9W7IZL4_HIBTR|nr:RED ELONGATED 1, SUPERROOT 2, ALTERED TRYPTOPHAN REGULATION 4, RUNT 1, cytochrome P450, family 83 [Hibiscus trionum]